MTRFLYRLRKILNHNRFISGVLYTKFKEAVRCNRQFISVATLLQFAFVVGAMEPKKHILSDNKTRAKNENSLDSKAQYYLNALKVRWMQLHHIPGLFAYQLQEARQGRILPGKYGFYAELNADRSLKRRAPQVIDSLNPKFSPKQFNFNKVDALEVMLTIDEDRDNAEVHMIINKSPITKYHTLICPEVQKELVQRITLTALNFCITFMRNISDQHIRLGYNSPGALASVNHLHFHLLHIPQQLYIDNVQLQPLEGDYVYRLKTDSPTEAICFIIKSKDSETEVIEKTSHVYRLTEWLCNNKLPHNLFITHDRESKDLRVFIFVRSKYCMNKDTSSFNVGFCEMVGYLPLGDEEKLKTITEQMVIDRIKDLTGNAYASVYGEVKHIIRGTSGSLIWHTLM